MSDQDARIRHILDNLPSLTAILDAESRYRFANRCHVGWFGEDPDALTGVHLREVIGDDALEALDACRQKALAGEQAQFSGEVSFKRGGTKYVRVTCSGLEPSETGDRAWLLVITDFSELHFTQQALGASTVRSQTILDTAVDAIVTIDRDGVIQSCNSATEHMFGYAAVELIGRNVAKLMPKSYAAVHNGYLDRYIETRERHIIGVGRDVTARRKNGTEFPAYLAVGEFTDRDRLYFTGFIRDMSIQKQAEQQARMHLDELSHLTRLSAVESLASGIMHEINQPLTAIVTMSQALLRMQRAGAAKAETIEDVLDRVVNQCVRVNQIVQQMRDLARKTNSADRARCDIDEIITDVTTMLDYEMVQQKVIMQTALGCKGCSVMVNRIQIEQVLVNLLQNAIHAVSTNDGARTLNIESNPPDAASAAVEIVVRDNGPGLPDPDNGDIFDPFFTTRSDGLGQGLSISRSIVETHGGRISAVNAADGGAIFRFTLPARDAEARPEQ